MIEHIGRSVAQKVNFESNTAYRPMSSPRGARAVFHEASLTDRGIHDTAESMNLEPGEVMAVWEIAPGDHRSIREVAQALPPKPSRLMVRGSGGKLLELNPAYIDINSLPPDYVPFTDEERAAFGVQG